MLLLSLVAIFLTPVVCTPYAHARSPTTSTELPSESVAPSLLGVRLRQAAVPAFCNDAECCALTAEQMRLCETHSTNCRERPNRTLLVDSRKCENCPAGQCRVGTVCMCGTNFLAHDFAKESCITSHGAVWNASVGRVDNTRRHCRDPNEPHIIPDECRRRSCCEMNEDDINKCYAHSDRCLEDKPTSRGIANVCFDCLPGECRLGQECVCPNSFLMDGLKRISCERFYGMTWPVLSNSSDKLRRGCTTQYPIQSYAPQNSSSAREVESTVMPSVAPVPGNPSSERASDANPNAGAANPARRVNPIGQKVLTSGEISGVVFGAIGAIAGVAGVLVTLFKRYEFVEVVRNSKDHFKHSVDG